MTAFIGRSVDRIDGRPKVTGAADYAGDIVLKGLVHAVMVGSEVAHGRVERIDTDAATRATGVLSVFTHENLPRLARQPVWDLLKVTGMSFAPMQDDTIEYAGQALAIVVAETLEQADLASGLREHRLRSCAASCDAGGRQGNRSRPHLGRCAACAL